MEFIDLIHKECLQTMYTTSRCDIVLGLHGEEKFIWPVGFGQVFISYQVAMADKIYTLLLQKDFEVLGRLVYSIHTKVDYEYIHNAFYDKHEFGWLAQIRKHCSYETCMKYGFYNYDF